MAQKPDLSDYVEVADRIIAFHERYPTGTLQSSYEYVFDKDGVPNLVIVTARAYRTPDDERPAIGLSAMQIPGKSNFTRDSELENCETSAWGRAIVAVGAATAKKVASREEVRNRQPVDNAAGLAAVGGLCAAKGWTTPEQKKTVADAFSRRFRISVAEGLNEDLEAFVSLVESGAVTIEFPDEQTGG